jgi:DNA-binding winged helix-turn-helix (wHTH) protein
MNVALARSGSPNGSVQLRFSVTFGPFRLDCRDRRLRRGEDPVPLRPKTFAVLEHLVARPGYLVSKEQLLEAVWPGTAISDTVLKVCVRELRAALGDTARSPRYIETAHRMGYRFIAGVERPVDAARQGDVLVVLDDCDQLIAATVDLLRALRQRAAAIRATTGDRPAPTPDSP